MGRARRFGGPGVVERYLGQSPGQGHLAGQNVDGVRPRVLPSVQQRVRFLGAGQDAVKLV
ncbi:hypothetical protein ACIQVL_47180 [Streptomyces sp. NPDC090499]|uniref:hypothetical protein n=1 Tax=Streptomyces sp. NPDC090499 TaxID=3365965 RepID=UPI0038308756